MGSICRSRRTGRLRFVWVGKFRRISLIFTVWIPNHSNEKITKTIYSIKENPKTNSSNILHVQNINSLEMRKNIVCLHVVEIDRGACILITGDMAGNDWWHSGANSHFDVDNIPDGLE
jgi:hypothetical protein